MAASPMFTESHRLTTTRSALFLLIGLWLFFGASLAQAVKPAAEVQGITGTASVTRAGGGIKTLALGSKLFAGDRVTTQQQTRIRLRFADGGLVTLRSHASLLIEDFAYNASNPDGDKAVLRLLKGGMRALTGKIGHRGNRDAYKAKNFAATIGIRGTEYIQRLCGLATKDCANLNVPSQQRGRDGQPLPGLYFAVIHGRILAKNAVSNKRLKAGDYAYVRNFHSPIQLISPIAKLKTEYALPSRLLGQCFDPSNPDIDGCLVR